MSKYVLEEITDVQQYCNLQGMVRLSRVKSALKDSRISNQELIKIFNKWRNQKEYFVLWEIGKSKGKAYLCSKRGNDVYNYQINQKFKEIEQLAHFYGDSKLFDINQADPTTNCIFITLTYDTKLKSLDEAWKQIGIEYNRFVSGVKRKFGNVAIVRAFESFQNGYPHIHAIMLFDKKQFGVFEQWNKQGTKSSFRIKEKRDFEKYWHSHIDITAVHTIKGALGYLTKYLKKAYDRDSKYELTLAMLWIYHKQAFAISGKFYEKLKQIRLVLFSYYMTTEYDNIDVIGTTHEISQNKVDKKMNAYYHKQELSTVIELFKLLNFNNFNQIIDLGCSIGTWYNDFRKLGFKKIHGIDISEDRLKIAKNRGYDTIHCCNAYELPYNDNSQDLVISNDVLVHVMQDDDKSKIFNEVHRILKRNGIFIFNIANSTGFGYDGDISERYCRYNKIQTIEKMIQKSGLNIEKISPSYYAVPRIGAHANLVSFSSSILFPFTDSLLKIIKNYKNSKVVYFATRKT